MRLAAASAFTVATGLVFAACDDGSTAVSPTSTEAPEPDADAYHAALATVLDGAPPAEGEDRPVVYLVPLDDGIGIETQAAVIESFVDAYDVRFVDDLGAAVDQEDPVRPPRDDAMVLGLGSIDREPPHLVRLERYRSVDDIDASLLTLEFDDEVWLVVLDDPVPAEVLADVP